MAGGRFMPQSKEDLRKIKEQNIKKPRLKLPPNKVELTIKDYTRKKKHKKKEEL